MSQTLKVEIVVREDDGRTTWAVIEYCVNETRAISFTPGFNRVISGSYDS
jgi:hypothetical protein